MLTLSSCLFLVLVFLSSAWSLDMRSCCASLVLWKLCSMAQRRLSHAMEPNHHDYNSSLVTCCVTVRKSVNFLCFSFLICKTRINNNYKLIRLLLGLYIITLDALWIVLEQLLAHSKNHVLIIIIIIAVFLLPNFVPCHFSSRQCCYFYCYKDYD